MTNIEIAEAIKDTNMYELACKTNAELDLTDSEKTTVAQLDAYFKKVGERGADPEREIAAFIRKAVNEEIYNAPDELLDYLFNRDTIGEFDDFEDVTDPKNTLVAYETAKGANVKRSFLDIGVLKPQWFNLQIETDISYKDLRKNGWKEVSKITEFAVAAFKNKMFKMIFDKIDAGITEGAENYLNVGGSVMTQAAGDALALYVNDRANGDGVIVGKSAYIQQLSKLNGFASDEMKNEVHRTGRLGSYDGCEMFPISGAKKLGDGSAIFSDKRVYGIAGQIGSLNMKGETNVYETMDNNNESVHLKFADFTFGVCFNKDTLEKVYKAVLS